MMKRSLFFGLILILLLTLAARNAFAAKVVDKSQIKGAWTVTYMERNGKPVPVEQLRMEIYEYSIKLIQNSRPATQVSYYVDLRNNPGTFSWFTHGRLGMRTQLGIYQVDDTTLTICLGSVGGPTPSTFQSPHNDGQTLFVMKRTPPGPALPLPRKKQWLSLGVFSLSIKGEPTVRSIMTISADPAGDLQGEVFNVESRTRLPLKGKVDKTTGEVSITISGDEGITLKMYVDDFSAPSADVAVTFKSRPAQTWTITPAFSQPPSAPQGEEIK